MVSVSKEELEELGIKPFPVKTYQEEIISILENLNAIYDSNCKSEALQFLQDSGYMGLWVQLIGFVDKIDKIESREDFDSTSDPLLNYVCYLLEVREIKCLYLEVGSKYADLFQKTIQRLEKKNPSSWMNTSTLEKLVDIMSEQDITSESLEACYEMSIQSRQHTYNSLRKIQHVWEALFYHGMQRVIDLRTFDDEIRRGIIAFVSANAYWNSKRMMGQLKRQAQNYRGHRNAPLTPEIWGEVMRAEDEALNLAVLGQLSGVEDSRFDSFDEEMRVDMEKHPALMQKMLNVFSDAGLFDFQYAAEDHVNLFSCINAENICLFADLVLRYNLIQCEMFPQLKAEYEKWMNGDDEETGKGEVNDSGESLLSDADKALLDRMLKYIEKGNWQRPATSENVKAYFTDLFMIQKFRDFFKGGKGGSNCDRADVAMANFVGYLMRCQLLSGGPKQTSIDFFNNEDQVNNINRGKNANSSQTFKNLLPLLDEKRNLHIR